MPEEHVRMVALKKCGGVASFTGSLMSEGAPHLAVTVANISYLDEIMLIGAHEGRGVYEVDFDFENECFKHLVRLVVSRGASAEGVRCTVSTKRWDCTRTLWAVVPLSLDGVNLLENVGRCVESALDVMARRDDGEL